MATSPTSSPLGAVADVGRPAASAATGPVGKSEDADANSSFSAALSDARGAAGETLAAADAANATNTKAEKGTVTNASESDAALSALLLMRGNIVKPATAGGKALPPDGESLPQAEQIIVATADLLSLESNAAPNEATLVDKTVDAEIASDAALTPITVVLPENPVQAAMAAQSRGAMVAPAEDGSHEKNIGDATSSPKREIPTPSQTLVAESADAAATADVIDETQGVSGAAPQVNNNVARADKRSFESAAMASAAANVQRREPMNATGAAPNGTETAQAPAAAGKNTEMSGFVDALKQADSSLAATVTQADGSSVTTSTPTGDISAAASVRDTGLRQYQQASAATARVEVPVGKPGWSEAMADKVMWMSAQNMSSAEIHLNPADLGPLSVRISSHQDQTSVFFTSSHAGVRDALDQSLPRLREMFSGQGMQLLDVGVGDQNAARQQMAQREASSQTSGRAGVDRGASIDEVAVSTRAVPLPRHAGLLDAYA